jgi:hypothetical protein
MDLERAKDTIAKLLNLAKNDAATEGEVNNAIAFATKMMLQYQLSEEDIKEEAEETLEEQIARAETGSATGWGINEGKASNWESTLGVWVTKFVGGVYVAYGQVQPKRVNGIAVLKKGVVIETKPIIFYGLVDDAQFAKETYEELCVIIASMARLKWGSVFRGKGREYAEGFVSGLYATLKKATVEQNTSDGTALVVRRDHLVKIKEKRALETYQKVTGARPRGYGSSRRSGVQRHYDARMEGQADGAKTSVAGRASGRLSGDRKLLN